MFLIDTHTHLYQPAFDGDRGEAMERCLEAGVDMLLLPNIDSKSIVRVHDMLHCWPNHCLGMMGLHPCHVQEGWEAELEVIEKALDEPLADSPWVAANYTLELPSKEKLTKVELDAKRRLADIHRDNNALTFNLKRKQEAKQSN